MEDLLGLEECIDTTPPVAWPVAPSPVHLSNWEGHLRTHPDKRLATYICSGLANGFRIGFNRQGSVLGPMARNHPSATSNREAVQDYNYIGDGSRQVSGESLIPFVHVSSLGLVPKSHQPNRFRMIVDLSFPKGRSINDGISKVLASISYASVDDAVHYILTLGRGAQLVKLDLRNAYRIVPVHHKTNACFQYPGKGDIITYVDRALPFGLRSAPKIFSAVADTIAWVLHGAGIERLIHYLDDFLFVGSPNTDEAAQAKEIALRVLLEHLGVPVAAHKTEGPASLITFLGILVDTEAFELRLPAFKHSWILGSPKRPALGITAWPLIPCCIE